MCKYFGVKIYANHFTLKGILSKDSLYNQQLPCFLPSKNHWALFVGVLTNLWPDRFKKKNTNVLKKQAVIFTLCFLWRPSGYDLALRQSKGFLKNQVVRMNVTSEIQWCLGLSVRSYTKVFLICMTVFFFVTAKIDGHDLAFRLSIRFLKTNEFNHPKYNRVSSFPYKPSKVFFVF